MPKCQLGLIIGQLIIRKRADIGPPFFFATVASRFFTAIWLFWFWLSDVDIKPFFQDNISKIFEVRKWFTPSFINKFLQGITNWIMWRIQICWMWCPFVWADKVSCLEGNFESFWWGVMERYLYIIWFSTFFTSVSGFSGVISKVTKIYV